MSFFGTYIEIFLGENQNSFKFGKIRKFLDERAIIRKKSVVVKVEERELCRW